MMQSAQQMPPEARNWAMQQAGQAMMNSAQPPPAAGQPGQPQQPPQQQVPSNQAPWWMKYAAKALGAVGGLIAIGLGAFNCVTVTPLYLLAGIWQIMAGFLVTVLEAPFLCMFIDFVQNLSKKMENASAFFKGGLYIAIAIPAVLMCQTASIIIGSGLIFSAGVLNGLMALGKKASREEMLGNAASDKVPIVVDPQPMATS
ncbi:calcium channel flower-like isoform X2 [Amphibalanus amphitrite]|uniref:calcium channel flower-like isoform X2 n=1 Tax=Amphibalanus amphitrite TaxID=1232801 RepID=UPI001C909454|nr:calcium channel flower-like isoform X2 [Amphibalanus amphitrite]